MSSSAKGTHLSGTPHKGDNRPDANMPANNHGTYPVKLGSGQKSQFAQSGSGQGGARQSSTGGKANMPANNVTDRKVSLGTTKHSVGGVPGYLKGN